MYAIVSKYDPSKSDRKSYSKRHGITLNVFCYWRGKWLAEQKQKTLESITQPKAKLTPKKTSTTSGSSTPTFVPFEVTAFEQEPSPATADSPKSSIVANTSTICEINYPNGVQLKLNTVDLRLLRELLCLDV